MSESVDNATPVSTPGHEARIQAIWSAVHTDYRSVATDETHPSVLYYDEISAHGTVLLPLKSANEYQLRYLERARRIRPWTENRTTVRITLRCDEAEARRMVPPMIGGRVEAFRASTISGWTYLWVEVAPEDADAVCAEIDFDERVEAYIRIL